MNRLEQKEAFIKALAELFGGANSGWYGVRLGPSFDNTDVQKAAQDWVKLRQASPIFGYPTVEEAEKVFKEFLC